MGWALQGVQLDVLPGIFTPHVSIVVVRRAAFAMAARRALLPLMGQRAFQLSGNMTRQSLDRDVKRLCAALPFRFARAVLVPDIVQLAGRFLELTGGVRARVQLERVTRDACRRFHDDQIGLRMLCTYFGPGTEWLDDRDVCAEVLEALGGNVDEANRRIVRDADKVRRAQAGDVLVLKGARYPGRARHGAVHRSPPIEAERASRLVLKIDEESR